MLSLTAQTPHTIYCAKSFYDDLDEAITEFAFAYSDQNERDYAAMQKAARTRRIKVSRVF